MRPWRPLFTPLLPLARVPFQAKESVQKTPFWENLENFSLNSLNFHPNFSSQAQALKFGNFQHTSPKIGNFQLTSPQIWKFYAHKPPFSEANVSSQAPHFGNPGRTPTPEKKLSAPRGYIVVPPKSAPEMGSFLWIITHVELKYRICTWNFEKGKSIFSIPNISHPEALLRKLPLPVWGLFNNFYNRHTILTHVFSTWHFSYLSKNCSLQSSH